MSNSVDPDEMSHLDLRNLQTLIIIVFGAARGLEKFQHSNMELPNRRDEHVLASKLRQNLQSFSCLVMSNTLIRRTFITLILSYFLLIFFFRK